MRLMSPRFIHLRLHSEYSISDGIVRLDQACERAAADAMPALALTDLGNLFGMVKFYQAARAKGLKPIVGCDAWIANDKGLRNVFTAAAPGFRVVRVTSRAGSRVRSRAGAAGPPAAILGPPR